MKVELPEWLLDENRECRTIDCLPECPAYDYGCRLRADSVAGDRLRRKNTRLRELYESSIAIVRRLQGEREGLIGRVERALRGIEEKEDLG